MTCLTKNQCRKLERATQAALAKVGEDQDARQIMTEIYVESLPDKTPQQAGIIVDAIYDEVRHFQTAFEDGKKSIDRFVEDFQEKADEGRSCVDRCNYWIEFAAAVSGADLAANGEMTPEEVQKAIDGRRVTEEQATPEREEQARKDAAKALKGSGILLSALKDEQEQVETAASGQEAATILLNAGEDQYDYRAIMSMVAYTEIKSGGIEGIPDDFTAQQTAAVVCATLEQYRVLEAVGRGQMALDVAANTIYVLGIVLVAELAIGAVVTAGAFFGPLVAIPLAAAIAGAMFGFGGKALPAWKEASRNAVKSVTALAQAIWRGMKALWRYVKEHIAPKVVSGARAAWDTVSAPWRSTTVVETETAAAPAQSETIRL